MDTAVVACAQQRLRLYESLNDYRHDCVRFLRMAQSKGASLVVLPELSGLMAAVPHLPGVRASLLRQADQGRQRGASLWKRAKARLAESTAGLLGADFRAALARHLAEQGNELRREIERLFAELARSYGTYLLVGAGYLPGDGPGQRALALAFSPQGEQIGEAARVGLLPGDEGMVTPGDAWAVVQTPAGRLGILLGGDVLYPEVARLLAYRGADVLVVMAATSDPALAARIRMAALARAQENQVFVLVSFLIGNDPLRGDNAQFTGRSAIMAPAEMTERYTGILAEMGTAAAEGLIAAELNFKALRALWRGKEFSARQGAPLMLAGQALVSDYTMGRSVDDAWKDVETSRRQTLLLPEPARPPVVPVTDLPVVAVSEASLPLADEESPQAPAELEAKWTGEDPVAGQAGPLKEPSLREGTTNPGPGEAADNPTDEVQREA